MNRGKSPSYASVNEGQRHADMVTEFVTDWEKSAMQSLFPEILGTGCQLKLFPITERHLQGVTPDSDVEADEAESSE